MKYLVFQFDSYYPSGGWNDFKGLFDTLDEAKEHINKYDVGNYHVIELHTDTLSFSRLEADELFPEEWGHFVALREQERQEALARDKARHEREGKRYG